MECSAIVAANTYKNASVVVLIIIYIQFVEWNKQQYQSPQLVAQQYT